MTDMSEITAEGVTQLRLAAEQDDVQAMSSLAKCYWHGTGVRQDKEIAIAWWQRAAAQGDSSAQFTLALCKLNGDGFGKDEHWAIREIATLADAGNKEALEWQAGTRAKAEGHNLEAQYLWLMSIPALVKWDWDVSEADHDMAKTWLERAVAQSDAGAKLVLSSCYGGNTWEFLGIPKDNKKEIELELEAAKLGNAEAQAYIGASYMYGDNVIKDADKGYGFLRLGIAKLGGTAKDRKDLCVEYVASVEEIGSYLGSYFEGWPLRSGMESIEFCPDEDDGREKVVEEETPFWKCGNVAFWAKYINDYDYQKILNIEEAARGTNTYAELLRFNLERWSTIAEIDEFRRIFYWMNGSKEPLSLMLDGLDVWQLINNISKKPYYDHEYEYDRWGFENYKTGQFSVFVDQWMQRNKTMLAETYPLFTDGAWNELGTTLNGEFNRLRVVMNVILRSSLVKTFGSYEKHIAMLAPLIENKFAVYEDYKAYVDTLPSDKNDEFYQRLREKLGFVTEEGYRRSFA